MAYKNYSTPAIVIRSQHQNTADKVFLLLTEVAGLIYATARSVREERSRQRTALQDFSVVTVSLVRGRLSWKIGSVEALHNHFLATPNRSVRKSLVMLHQILITYIHGEEQNDSLFSIVHSAHHWLGDQALQHRELWENFIHVQILTELGYVAPSKIVADLLKKPYREIDTEQLLVCNDECITHILNAKENSHLDSK